METKKMVTKQKCIVKNGPGLHGADIPGAVIYSGQYVLIELSAESPHEGWVHLVGPNPPINEKGLYLKTKHQAWVELAHLGELSTDKSVITIEIDWTNKTFSCR